MQKGQTRGRQFSVWASEFPCFIKAFIHFHVDDSKQSTIIQSKYHKTSAVDAHHTRSSAQTVQHIATCTLHVYSRRDRMQIPAISIEMCFYGTVDLLDVAPHFTSMFDDCNPVINPQLFNQNITKLQQHYLHITHAAQLSSAQYILLQHIATHVHIIFTVRSHAKLSTCALYMYTCM